MKKISLIASIAFILALNACGNKSETQSTENSSPENETPQIINYNEQIIYDFKFDINSIDSLKPQLINQLGSEFEWLTHLTKEDSITYKEEIKTTKLNLLAESFYHYKTIITEKLSEYDQKAHEEIMLRIEENKNKGIKETPEERENFRKELINKYDLESKYLTTENELNRLKLEFEARLNK